MLQQEEVCEVPLAPAALGSAARFSRLGQTGVVTAAASAQQSQHYKRCLQLNCQCQAKGRSRTSAAGVAAAAALAQSIQPTAMAVGRIRFAGHDFAGIEAGAVAGGKDLLPVAAAASAGLRRRMALSLQQVSEEMLQTT